MVERYDFVSKHNLELKLSCLLISLQIFHSRKQRTEACFFGKNYFAPCSGDLFTIAVSQEELQPVEKKEKLFSKVNILGCEYPPGLGDTLFIVMKHILTAYNVSGKSQKRSAEQGNVTTVTFDSVSTLNGSPHKQTQPSGSDLCKNNY